MTELASKTDMMYLKSRHEIIEALPDTVKCDKNKVTSEFEFYPAELLPFMGTSVMGRPLSFRYRSDHDIFDMEIDILSPGDGKSKKVTSPIKSNWVEILSPDHKKLMEMMLKNDMTGVFVAPGDDVVSGESTGSEEVDDEYDTEEVDDEEYNDEDDDFEETCIIYLKTASEMGITPDNLSSGEFVGSEYYPQQLRQYAGTTITLRVQSFLEDDNRKNILSFSLPAGSLVTVHIPVPGTEGESDALLFDYQNWLSLFADVIETTGPRINDYVSALKYVASLVGSSVSPAVLGREKIESTCKEPEAKPVTPDGKLKPKFVALTPGDVFFAVLSGHKELGISEEAFYSKSFVDSDLYDNNLISMAGTVVEASYIDEKYSLVVLEEKSYDIPFKFLTPIEGKLEKRMDDPVLDSLPAFDKSMVCSEMDEDIMDDFIFITHPTVNGRITAHRFKETALDLVNMLGESLILSKFNLGIITEGISTDFIMVTGFKKGVDVLTIPVDLLDTMMFYKMTDSIDVFVSQGEDKGAFVYLSISELKNMLEDIFLTEASDEFDENMFSGSALRSLILEKHPDTSYVELRKISK